MSGFLHETHRLVGYLGYHVSIGTSFFFPMFRYIILESCLFPLFFSCFFSYFSYFVFLTLSRTIFVLFLFQLLFLLFILFLSCLPYSLIYLFPSSYFLFILFLSCLLFPLTFLCQLQFSIHLISLLFPLLLFPSSYFLVISFLSCLLIPLLVLSQSPFLPLQYTCIIKDGQQGGEYTIAERDSYVGRVLKPFSAQAHTLNKAFLGAVGFSRSSF